MQGNLAKEIILRLLKREQRDKVEYVVGQPEEVPQITPTYSYPLEIAILLSYIYKYTLRWWDEVYNMLISGSYVPMQILEQILNLLGRVNKLTQEYEMPQYMQVKFAAPQPLLPYIEEKVHLWLRELKNLYQKHKKEIGKEAEAYLETIYQTLGELYDILEAVNKEYPPAAEIHYAAAEGWKWNEEKAKIVLGFYNEASKKMLGAMLMHFLWAQKHQLKDELAFNEVLNQKIEHLWRITAPYEEFYNKYKARLPQIPHFAPTKLEEFNPTATFEAIRDWLSTYIGELHTFRLTNRNIPTQLKETLLETERALRDIKDAIAAYTKHP